MKSMSSRLIAGGALVAFGVLVAVPADAGYEKLPGSRCNFEFFNATGGGNTDYNGAYFDVADTNAYTIVTCPIPYTNALPDTAMTTVKVDLDVLSTGPSTQYTVQLCAFANNTLSGSCGAQSLITNPSTGYRQISVDTFGVTQDTSNIKYPSLLFINQSSSTNSTLVTSILGIYAGT